jgi:hypothetical protein
MSEPITPALTPEEWADRHFKRPSHTYATHYSAGVAAYGQEAEAGDDCNLTISDTEWQGADNLAALIALTNDALPDGDPRKITREWVRSIRTVADALEHNGYGSHLAVPKLRAIADALESYLPPEA